MALRSIPHAFLTLVSLWMVADTTVHASPHETSTVVRPVGMAIAALLRDGAERSPTFRSLVEQLDGSEWIVFVQAGSCRLSRITGSLLHRMGVFEGRRYLRVVLSDTSATHDDAIATIGHELQHAAEVVREPRITQASDIQDLYRRIGYVSVRTTIGAVYETKGAVRAGAQVLTELRFARRTAARERTASR
jgi:hypothetical protein